MPAVYEYVIRIDEYIIKVDYDTNISKTREYAIYKLLEGCGNISKIE